MDNILDLPMEENDAEAQTIREYLKALLTTLWEEGESFSGKRPFGNSGWEWDLYKPLVKYSRVKGKIDEDGDIEDLDEKQANKVIASCIDYIFLPQPTEKEQP